ncbi:hypothetical protein QTP86_006475 [Hemibagrus guttatus]|nr:hypothetical protein QTP86_006475 [Hemibagrus guttatus]
MKCIMGGCNQRRYHRFGGYTSSVTSYISKCIDDVTISKSITTRSNQKLWMTAACAAKIEGHSLQSWRQGGPKNSMS